MCRGLNLSLHVTELYQAGLSRSDQRGQAVNSPLDLTAWFIAVDGFAVVACIQGRSFPESCYSPTYMLIFQIDF